MKVEIELTGILETAVENIATREGQDPAAYFIARCLDLAAGYARQEGLKVIEDQKAAAIAAVEADIAVAMPAKAEAVEGVGK